MIITLQIRKSSLKIKTAKCCLVVDNFLLLKFSLGIFNFFISVTEQVLLVIIAMRFFKIYFPLMVNGISLFSLMTSGGWGVEPLPKISGTTNGMTMKVLLDVGIYKKA